MVSSGEYIHIRDHFLTRGVQVVYKSFKSQIGLGLTYLLQIMAWQSSGGGWSVKNLTKKKIWWSRSMQFMLKSSKMRFIRPEDEYKWSNDSEKLEKMRFISPEDE